MTSMESKLENCFEHWLHKIYPDPAGSSLRAIPLFQPSVYDYDVHVIIPVYNTAPYLRQCIESVLSQTGDVRIFLTIVNDGSTDDSGFILSQYAELDHVQVITQPNQGMSAARNAGMQLLCAPYLFFLDSDDYLYAEDAIYTLWQLALTSNAEIVEGSTERFNDEGKVVGYKMHDESLNPNKLYGFAWNKIMRSEIFCNYQFPEGYLFEDTIFSMLIFWRYRRWATTSKVTYRYRYNTKGISMSSRGQKKILLAHWVTRRILSDYIISGGQMTLDYRKNLEQEFANTLSQVRTLHNPWVYLLVWADNKWLMNIVSH